MGGSIISNLVCALDRELCGHGHDMSWRRARGKPRVTGTCQNCHGKVIAGVRAGGAFTEWPEPDILRTRFRLSFRRCRGC